MKKLLLLTAVAAMTVPTLKAADPVFPETLDVTSTTPGVKIEQYIDDAVDALMIEVSGWTKESEVELNFTLPAGWDNVLAGKVERNVLSPKKANPVEMIPLSAFKMWFEKEYKDVREGTSFKITALEDTGWMAYLCADDEVDTGNAIEIWVHMKQGEAPDPEFPASFNVKADSPNVTIEQYLDEDTDAYTISVTGTTDKDELALDIAIPEGWDNIIGAIIDYEQNRPKKAREDWPTVEIFKEAFSPNTTLGGNLVFPVGKGSMGSYYLVYNDQVDVDHGFVVLVDVTKEVNDDPIVVPALPESLTATVDDENVTVSQDVDEDTYSIMLTGETDKEEVTLTIDVPEGWSGLIGGDILDKVEPTKTRSAYEEWPTVEELLAANENMAVANTYTFKVAEESQVARFYLVFDGRVNTDNPIDVISEVKAKGDGVAAIEGEGAAVRYYNLQGIEVSTPENGLFIKVANGKAHVERR